MNQFKGGELKGAEKLPPLSVIPAAWKEKDRTRSRSASPARSPRKKTPVAEKTEQSEMASEAEKMALRVQMVAHPEVTEAMKPLPPLPKEMLKETLEARKQQFAAELANLVPRDLVLLLLSFIARLIDWLVGVCMALRIDTNAEYKSDESLQKSMTTQLALHYGDYLSPFNIMLAKLFVIHPLAAVQKGTPLTPAPAPASERSKSVVIASPPPPPSASVEVK